jgi:hypothetical protein
MNVLRAVFNFLYGILLGCRHEHLTRPFTIEKQTYEVCLDCGKHLFYSADAMRPMSAREMRRMRAVQSGELKIVPVSGASAALTSESDSRAVA